MVVVIKSGMKIVSLSMSEKMIRELDTLQKTLGFTGRSEAVRAGIKSLLSENKSVDEAKGEIHAILLVVHDEHDEYTLMDTKHKYENIIVTQIHNNLGHDNCLEVFVLKGDADKVKKLFRDFKSNDKMEYVKLVVT